MKALLFIEGWTSHPQLRNSMWHNRLGRTNMGNESHFPGARRTGDYVTTRRCRAYVRAVELRTVCLESRCVTLGRSRRAAAWHAARVVTQITFPGLIRDSLGGYPEPEGAPRGASDVRRASAGFSSRGDSTTWG
jgi:hypothetical protein